MAVEQEPEGPTYRYSRLTIGGDNGCIVENGHIPICWGTFFSSNDAPRVLEELNRVKHVEIRTSMSGCALSENDELYCFGAYGEEERYQLMDERSEELEAQLDDPELSDARAEEIEAEMASLEHMLLPIRVAADVRLFTVNEGGGCYLTDDALRCWKEEGEGGQDETTIPSQNVVQLDSAETHRCYLNTAGEVICWGFGSGLGFTPDEESDDYTDAGPAPTPARDAVEIALGEEFTCYRRRDGKVACWGFITETLFENEDDIPEVNEPVVIPGVEGAQAIAAGATHACAIVENGRVLCWGENRFGELGTGDTRTVYAPVEAEALSPARELALGRNSTCALVEDELRCIGNNRYRAFGPEPDAPEVFAFPARGTRLLTPGYRTCVETNGAWSCTSYERGRTLTQATELRPLDADVEQLESYLGYSCRLVGRDLACSYNGNNAQTLSGVTQISVGTKAACALMQDRRVQCWRLPYTRTGTGPLLGSAEPTVVPGLRRVDSIHVGTDHACAVRANGQVSCWGNNAGGLLRTPNGVVDTAVDAGVTNAAQVSVDRASTCVRLRDQTVRCRRSGDWREVEVQNVVEMTTQSNARFLLTANHEVYQRGFATVTKLEVPENIVEISSGTSHTCGRSRDGAVHCWGSGEHGEFGSLPTWIHLQPARVSLVP